VTRLALRHESIAARIEAVERIAVLGRGDASLERALWERLRDDPSVNVRLAAIDVLYSTPDLAPPVDHLIEILAREPAPLLRLALLDWIAAAGPPGWSRVLLAVEANDESAEVRGRARRLLGARS
jgi:HEAT repeat protein